MTEAEKPQAMPTIDLTDDEHAALALTRTRDGLGGSGGAAGIGTGLAALGFVASREFRQGRRRARPDLLPADDVTLTAHKSSFAPASQ